mmetsp:Transcript_10515/g.13297  ORF Transcript_10515/g.13297 Transcript_10515/m.13297 type:complete len:86 (-) Transcript_10515:2091-2348(-)
MNYQRTIKVMDKRMVEYFQLFIFQMFPLLWGTVQTPFFAVVMYPISLQLIPRLSTTFEIASKIFSCLLGVLYLNVDVLKSNAIHS